MIEASSRIPKHTLLLIVVAALGYFVDIYDLILFNVVKKESLLALGFSNPAEIKQISVSLFNWQMGGMLLGGILWGILGDKKGRLKVLFGSILLYSVANVLNAFVTDIPSYAAIRFIAGIGLAGELGAGITLVSEVMSKENRGYGTMIIVTFGALGAVLAAFVGGDGVVIRDLISSLTGLHIMNWQVAYIVGGVLGLLLLLLRIGTLESGMYKKMHDDSMGRGQFLKLFSNRETAIKYMHCIIMGLPVWFAAGVLFAMAEDFAQPSVLNIQGKVVNGLAVMYAYIGLSVGDLLSGLLSQFLRSRKKVVLFYLFLSACMLFVYLFGAVGHSATYFYFICFLVGVGAGYWALFVTIAAEQFGTNIRSTVASTAPNFVRGSVIPISASIHFFEKPLGVIGSAVLVGLICIALAIYSMMQLKDTFGKDLDYTETF
jgi:putative MFS transporter